MQYLRLSDPLSMISLMDLTVDANRGVPQISGCKHGIADFVMNGRTPCEL
jgi:hypothetical protein